VRLLTRTPRVDLALLGLVRQSKVGLGGSQNGGQSDALNVRAALVAGLRLMVRFRGEADRRHLRPFQRCGVVSGLLSKPPCESNCCLQVIWVRPDVCGLLANNLGCSQINVGLRPRILSFNLGRKLRYLQAEASMFAGRYT
jgi:hypothetical protein